jgi:hypothetical protein
VSTVTLPGRFVDWLDGTSAGQGEPDAPGVERMIAAVRAGTTRRRGRGYSVTLTPDDECRAMLREYAGYLLDTCQHGDDSPSEAAAARAVIERIDA